jgi:hypothetical protein
VSDLERRGKGEARDYSWPPFQSGHTLSVRSGFWATPTLRPDDRAEVEEIEAATWELLPVKRPEFKPAVELFSRRIWRLRRAYRGLSENGIVCEGQPASVLGHPLEARSFSQWLPGRSSLSRLAH